MMRKLGNEIAVIIIIMNFLFISWCWRDVPRIIYWKYMKWRYAPRLTIEFYDVLPRCLTDELRKAAKELPNDPNCYAIWKYIPDAQLDDRFPLKYGEQ